MRWGGEARRDRRGRDVGGPGFCGIGILRDGDAAGPVPLVPLALNCSVLGGLSPAGRGGRCTGPTAPDKACLGLFSFFEASLAVRKPQGRAREPLLCRNPPRAGLGPGPRCSPAEPPSPASPPSCLFSLLLRVFWGGSSAVNPFPCPARAACESPRADPEVWLSLPLAGAPGRGGGTGAMPEPKSQQH